MANDPFIFGREVTQHELVDRTDELREVVDVMTGGRRHFLIGPRRFGKTSLLTVAAAQARELGTKVIQVNAEEHATEAALVAEMIRQSAHELGFSIKDATSKLADVFGRLRPVIAYDGYKETYSIKLALDEVENKTALVGEAFTSLATLAKRRGVQIAVVIDEFQSLVAEGGITSERQLRAVVQRHAEMSYVFSGSDESMMIAMISQHSRPFYRLGSTRYLGPIPREDFAAYITAAFERAGAVIKPDATNRIFELAEDVPYSVQRLALACWTPIKNHRHAGVEGKRPTITVDTVEQHLTRHLQLEAPTYAGIVGQLTSNQVLTLTHLASHGREPVSWQAAARKLGLAATSIKRAVEALLAKSLVRLIYDGIPTRRYTFEDPFFRQFVIRNIKA